MNAFPSESEESTFRWSRERTGTSVVSIRFMDPLGAKHNTREGGNSGSKVEGEKERGAGTRREIV